MIFATLVSYSPSLHARVTMAWEEVQRDSYHRLTIPTRLHIYEQLINDMNFSLLSPPRRFPKLTPGLYRYFYLGWQTIQPLLPLWERQVRHWLSATNPSETDTSFADVMIQGTHHFITGSTEQEVMAWLETTSSFFKDVAWWNWGMCVSNMTDILPFTSSMCLLAIYRWFQAVCGLVPFPEDLPWDNYDNVNAISSNLDVTPYAWAATISVASVPLEQLGMEEPPINAQASLEFWRWWLFEVVPQAAVFDPETAGWQLNTNWYQH